MNLGGQLKELLAGEITDLSFGNLADAFYSAGIFDLHIDPQEKDYRLRARQGKQLVSLGSYSQSSVSPFVDFLRTKAGLKPHQTIMPEEGSFTVGDLLIKVFSLPTVNGEKLSLKVTKRNGPLSDLSELGFWGENLKILRDVPKLKSGLILVLGDGSPSTMLSLLAQFDAHTTLISTIENSHAIRLPLVNQFVAEKNYQDLAEKALKVALKQNSDVVMISRVDTPRLAELAVEASLDGKLVIAGLPLTDSFMVPEYLLHLGVQPFLLSSQLRLVINNSLIASAPSEKLKPVKVTAKESEDILSNASLDAPTLHELEKQAKKAGLNSNFKLGSNGNQVTTLYSSAQKDLTKIANIVEVVKINGSSHQFFLPGLQPNEARGLFMASGGITKETDHLVKSLRKLVPYDNIK